MTRHMSGSWQMGRSYLSVQVRKNGVNNISFIENYFKVT